MNKEHYRVLLVDDEPWNRDILRSLGEWETLGMTVAGEAEDGEEAIRLIEQHQPHIIITDMRMPGIDGVELLQTLSGQFPHIKVVVVSGYDDFNYAKHAIRHRATDYLLKPVNPDELNAVLAKCKGNWKRLNRGRSSGNLTPPPFPESLHCSSSRYACVSTISMYKGCVNCSSSWSTGWRST